MNPIILFVIFGAFLGTAGQFLLKALSSKTTLDFSSGFFRNFFGLAKEPIAYFAFLAYVASTVFYLKALKTTELGATYSVFIGITILLTFFGGILFLRESVSILKILGCFLILIGIVLVLGR